MEALSQNAKKFDILMEAISQSVVLGIGDKENREKLKTTSLTFLLLKFSKMMYPRF